VLDVNQCPSVCFNDVSVLGVLQWLGAGEVGGGIMINFWMLKDRWWGGGGLGGVCVILEPVALFHDNYFGDFLP